MSKRGYWLNVEFDRPTRELLDVLVDQCVDTDVRVYPDYRMSRAKIIQSVVAYFAGQTNKTQMEIIADGAKRIRDTGEYGNI